MKKKALLRKSILVILGLIILINIIGLVIEFLIGTNIIKIDSVNIREIFSFGTILSIAFIVAGIIFWIRYFKENNEKLVVLWNALAILSVLMILYKIIKPTMITIIPYYHVIFIALIVIIWFIVFKHLKKPKSAPRFHLQ